MNPNSNETSGLQFPMPEQMPDTSGAGNNGELMPDVAEQAPLSAERASVAEVSGGTAPPMALPLPPTPAPAAPQDNSAAATQAVSATIADDDDLIEKEWVSKAKQIVEATRNDPYKQSEELTAFKAEYMKKRYGKDIKLSKG